MLRLYMKANSDARKTEITSRGNQEISGQVLFGDKDDPKIALYFKVKWPKGQDRPSIEIQTGNEIDTKNISAYAIHGAQAIELKAKG